MKWLSLWKVPLQGLKSDLVLLSHCSGPTCFSVWLLCPFGGGQKSLSTRLSASLLSYLCVSVPEAVCQGPVLGTREAGYSKQAHAWERHRSCIAQSLLFCSPSGKVTKLHLETGLGKGSSWALRLHLACYKQFHRVTNMAKYVGDAALQYRCLNNPRKALQEAWQRKLWL